jgi:ATP-dependent helicase/DNAse subunit B
MPITLITGPANAGKAELVMEAVRRHLAHGCEPLLVVPTRADVEHYRRELAGDAAAMGVQVQRFRELIATAIRCAGERSPVLGAVARERLLAVIAAREGSGISAVAASAAFARGLARFIAELQERRVTPARLRGALLAAGGGGAPTAGLAGLFERYLLALRRVRHLDEEQRALRALDALRRKPALWQGRPVLFYGFDDLTRLQLDAIETLGVRVGADVTVSLAYEPGRAAFAGRAGTFQALAPLASRHQQLGARAEYYVPGARAALAHLERSLFEPDACREDPAGAVRLLEGADERAELELVATEIGALLRGGMAPGEIAVVMRTPPATADLLEEVFSAARIPYALQRRRRLADSAIGAALIGLLRCVPRPAVTAAAASEAGTSGRRDGKGDGAGAAQDLLAWLRAPGVLGRPELADWLEAEVRRTGAVSAEQARALWERRYWRLQTIDHLSAAQERGPGALAERAGRELAWLFSAARRGQASVLAGDELEEAGALASGRRALGELRELARIAPELAPPDAFALADALRGVEILSGARPSKRTVAVLDPLALRARRVRALFVCRLQEGVFPAPAPPRAVLSDEERRRLAEASGLLLGEHADALVAERYLLYAAVSRPEELLVVSWHAAGEDGAPAMRSLFVDDVCDLFHDTLGEQRIRGRPAAADASRSRRPAAGRGDCGRRTAGTIAPLRDRQLLAELVAHTWSPSSLGVWMSCPVRWLVERMLRAEDLGPDAEPLARGGLAHVALRQTLEGLRRETGSARLTPARLALARELLARALEENEPAFTLSAAPERRPGSRRRLRADLERYLEHAATTAAEEPSGRDALEPTYLELEFGFHPPDERAADGAEPGQLPAVDLGGGVMLRGRIDRVDVSPGGEALIYDYKGRNVWPAARWIGERDLQVALYMRAVESLLGVRVVGGFYQPLSGADLRARGVLEAGTSVQLDSVGDDEREPGEVHALLDEAVAAAREAAAQAGRGELQPRPRTCAFKGGCKYPAICRCEA